MVQQDTVSKVCCGCVAGWGSPSRRVCFHVLSHAPDSNTHTCPPIHSHTHMYKVTLPRTLTPHGHVIRRCARTGAICQCLPAVQIAGDCDCATPGAGGVTSVAGRAAHRDRLPGRGIASRHLQQTVPPGGPIHYQLKRFIRDEFTEGMVNTSVGYLSQSHPDFFFIYTNQEQRIRTQLLIQSHKIVTYSAITLNSA